ncbi:MAG: hypothetical protein DKT66_14460 [Candidatus Melainabacteria bacterium]|nr:MAG: hypothetical protein DKT66_14460 [Candidatus Melainabacteria bacterium]
MKNSKYFQLLLLLIFTQLSPGVLAVESADLHSQKFRQREFAKAQVHINLGNLNEALPILQSYRKTCLSSNSFENASFASLLIASILDQNGRFSDSIEECKAGLSSAERAREIGSKRNEPAALHCMLLWKLSESQFYAGKSKSAIATLEDAIEFAENRGLTQSKPDLLLQMRFQKALEMESINMTKAKDLFRDSKSERLKTFEAMSGVRLQEVSLKRKDIISVFKPEHLDLSNAQIVAIEKGVEGIPSRSSKLLTERGYFLVVYSPDTAGKIIQPFVTNRRRVMGSYNFVVKSLQISIDGKSRPKVDEAIDLQSEIFRQAGYAFDDALGDFSQTNLFLDAYCHDWKALHGKDPREPRIPEIMSPAARLGVFAQVFMGLAQVETPILYSDPGKNPNLEWNPAVTAVVKENIANANKPAHRFPSYFLKLKSIPTGN